MAPPMYNSMDCDNSNKLKLALVEAVASLRLVSPEAATDDVTCFFS